MPGPAIHHIVAKEVAKTLYTKLDASFVPFLNKLDSDYAPAFNLGSQGPDFLFFNTKDIDPSIKKLVDYYFEITDFIEDFKKQILAIIPEELKEAVDKLEEVYDDIAARSSTLTEISELLTEAKNLLALLKNTVTTKLEEFITDKINLFDLLKHPIQDGQKHNIWWWFDTLHYRRTGRYTQTLLANSAPGSLEHAYALGYLTHYAADIVGHPFVNIISGGSYRTHAKRHKLVENNQDVWAFNKYTGGVEFIQSRLGEKYIIGSDERKLPYSLNKFILDSLEKVYFKSGNPLYGRKMNSDDLNDAYRLWLWWFRRTTNALDLPKPEPYSFSDEIEEVWETFADNLEDLGSSMADGFSGDGGILGFLKALATAILAPFLVAAAAIDALIGTITTIGVAPLRFFISLIYDELYNSYMNLHQGLVLNGFAFPFNSQLSHYMIQHVFNSAAEDLFGHRAADLIQFFPTKEFKLTGMECESHLVYPLPLASNLEQDNCQGAPMSYYKADAYKYIFGPLEFSSLGYEKLKDFIEKTGGDTEALTNAKFGWLRRFTQKDIFGSAIGFSCFLYQEFLKRKKLGDFNLDADKGIGFKAWRKVKIFEHVNNPLFPHVAVEPENSVKNIQTDIIDPSEDIL